MKRISPQFDIQNKYRIRTYEVDTNCLKQDISFHNTVTDYWKNTVMPSFQPYSTRAEASFQLALGTGTGTHTSSDTSLFNQIYAVSIDYQDCRVVHSEGNPYISLTYSITLADGTATGNLTELALTRPDSTSHPFCIANFQDAEGNPITIEKTASTVLQLDIELQMTLSTASLPDNVHIGLSNGTVLGDNGSPVVSKWVGNPAYQGDYSAIPMWSNISRCTIASWLLGCRDNIPYISLNPNKGLGVLSCFAFKQGSLSTETVSSQLVTRITASDVAPSASFNLNDATAPYQIMSLGFRIGGCVIGIDLPDSDIFTPVELEFEIVGDGTTTDFNLPVPILSATKGCTVTIDNIEVDSSNYDWYGVNYQTIQPWIVSDWNNVVSYSVYDVNSNGYSAGVPTAPYHWVYASTWAWKGIGNDEIIYDFGSAITIDCVGRLSSNGVSRTDAAVYYSTDKPYNWVELKKWTTASAYGLEKLDTAIVARYWKIVPRVRNHTPNQQPGMPVIGQWDVVTKPTIRFHTAPGNEQVVRIKAYTDYPLKSSDWIYQTVSLDISKGAVT